MCTKEIQRAKLGDYVIWIFCSPISSFQVPIFGQLWFSFSCWPLAMPPKKRQKTMANSKTTQPQTMNDVAPGRMSLRDWIGQVYHGRHGFPEQRKWPLQNGGTFLEMVQRVWSDEDNFQADSFAMLKKLGIMDSSATDEDFQMKYMMMKDWLTYFTFFERYFWVGFILGSWIQRLKSIQLCSFFYISYHIMIIRIMGKAFSTDNWHLSTAFWFQENPPQPGAFFSTSILQWSFARESFWRLPDMATVLDIAKSISMVGWKEARKWNWLGTKGSKQLNTAWYAGQSLWPFVLSTFFAFAMMING